MDYNALSGFLLENSAAAAQLKRDSEIGTPAHAYLISSPDGFTARLCAGLLAHLEAAGGKEELAQAVFTGRHADVMVVPQEGETVLSADIDNLVSNLYLRPTQGDKKFFIIAHGETMNAACQNKLLKSLEEPPACAHIIICCSRAGAMLPTISSRCKKIEAETFTDGQIIKALGITNPECTDAGLAAALSGGKLGEAIKLCSDKKYMQVFDTACAALTGLNSSKDILAAASRVLNYKDRLNIVLDFFELCYRDVLAVKSNAATQLGARYSVDIEVLAGMYSLDAALKSLEAVSRAKKRIKGYGNVNSIVDELFFSIAENKSKYK